MVEPSDIPSASTRRTRRRAVERLAAGQDGVVSRRQLYAIGITRWELRANLRAGRWRAWGSQSIAVFTGQLTMSARCWAAVFEAGPRAFLDGVAALRAAGLERYEDDRIRVSVPRGARVRRAKGVDIRQTRRWAADDLLAGSAPPRSRTETAAIRAALWARSDKQAALLLTMVIQQRLVSIEALGTELMRVRRDRRRAFINSVLLDVDGGARSLGELEFARKCRRRGPPEPSRQVVRRGPGQTYYLDVLWERWRVSVEIDGIQHLWPENVVRDALRHNDVTLGRCRVLRLPLLGLRVAPDEFFGQIEAALRAAGWPGAVGHSA